MTAALCPYCQGPISESEESLLCSGCDTPHHKDCYEENKGCTVFGCKCAPPEEPKMSVSTPELMRVGTTVAAAPAPAGISERPAAPPPPEREMSIDELQQIAYRVVPSIFSSYDETPALPGRADIPEPGEPKNRMGFMILGALLGPFGAHNWYAGYYKKAAIQLAITVLTLGFGSPMSWIWAIIDICTIDKDNNDVQFSS
jgi:hypothetical protein